MVRKEQLIFLFQLAQFSIEIWYSFRLTNTEDEVVIQVEPTLITLWKYDSDNKPLREYLMIEEEKAYREYYIKVQ